MAVRQTEVVYAPYQATFNAIDLGGIEKFEVQIKSKTASAELINGVTLKRDVAKEVSVLVTLVETGGVKTSLAALFPALYTTNTGKAQVLWNINSCGGGTAPQNLILTSDCDTGTAEDFTFFGAVPNLEGIETPNDGPRKIMVRFEVQGDATGKHFQLGSTA